LDSVVDPDPIKEKSIGIRIQVKSWILIQILLQHVLQSEKPGAVEALDAEWFSSWSRRGSTMELNRLTVER
jgi:hypothetical protein